MTTLTTLRSVLEALTNTLPTMHKNTTTLGKVNYHAAKDAITDMTALIADMKKAEPVEDSDLLAALAEVRDLFPMPKHGSPVEREWAAAMADPYNVPNYVRACIAQPKAEPVQEPK